MLRHIAALLWNTRRSGILLTLQIFLAFIVLFGVLSFTSANFARYATPLGFDVANSYVANVDLPEGVDSAAAAELHRRAREEVAALPGVAAVGMLSGIEPFENSNWGFGTDDPGFHIWTRVFIADEHYGEAADLELVRGRWFTPGDTIGGRWPVVVTQRFMDQNFPHGNPLDSPFVWFGGPTTIVGVVGNFKYLGEFATEEPLTFIPDMPRDWGGEDFMLTNLLIRTAPGTPASIEETIYETISVVVGSRESTVEALEQRRERTSRSSWVPLIALLSICAFLVANVALGLFGILINAIAKRRGEIGLRKALGATGTNITAQFTAEVVLIALLGIALGAVVAVQIPMLELLPLETKFFWWGGLAAVGLILTLVVLCALIPSGQAARIHPAVALRED